MALTPMTLNPIGNMLTYEYDSGADGTAASLSTYIYGVPNCKQCPLSGFQSHQKTTKSQRGPLGHILKNSS